TDETSSLPELLHDAPLVLYVVREGFREEQHARDLDALGERTDDGLRDRGAVGIASWEQDIPVAIRDAADHDHLHGRWIRVHVLRDGRRDDVTLSARVVFSKERRARSPARLFATLARLPDEPIDAHAPQDARHERARGRERGHADDGERRPVSSLTH